MNEYLTFVSKTSNSSLYSCPRSVCCRLINPAGISPRRRNTEEAKYRGGILVARALGWFRLLNNYWRSVFSIVFNKSSAKHPLDTIQEPVTFDSALA